MKIKVTEDQVNRLGLNEMSSNPTYTYAGIKEMIDNLSFAINNAQLKHNEKIDIYQNLKGLSMKTSKWITSSPSDW